MAKGGVLVVNTRRAPADILKFIPNQDLLRAIACVDADGIAGTSTVDFSGSEGGVDVVGLGAGIAAPLLGAVAKATSLVTLDTLGKVVKNTQALQLGYEQTVLQGLN
jgi:hypothetical protein